MGHDPWHEMLNLAAAAVLTGGGGIFVALALIGRIRGAPGPPREPPAGAVAPADLGTLVTILAATLSVAAAAIHLAAAPAHVEDLGLFGWGFVAAGVFQAAWALAYGIQPSHGTAAVAIAANLGIVAAWLWSRTLGLPFGALAGVAEPVGTPDAAATVFEILLVALLAGRRLDLEARIAARLRDARTVGMVALVPAVGIVFLATTLAVSLALGHSHAPGDGHRPSAGSPIEAHR